MNLTLSDVASIAEVVSGLAVVITLVFLILSVRENSDITRAEMYSSHQESLNEMFRDIYRDPELMRIHDAWLANDFSSLDAHDTRVLSYLVTNAFRTY